MPRDGTRARHGPTSSHTVHSQSRAADVPELVREHGALNRHGLTAERGRQQDDRRPEAERERLTELWNEADRGALS